nr:cytochrome c [Novosphingobium flavum]
MAGIVDPAADVVWEITNRNVDDLGYGAADKYAAGDWARLYAASSDIRRGAAIIANAPRLRAAAPGAKIADQDQPGATNAADVQRRIDSDPKSIRAHARNLAALAADLEQAAVRRDAKTAQDLAGALDGACEACHLQYWYYNQEPVK